MDSHRIEIAINDGLDDGNRVFVHLINGARIQVTQIEHVNNDFITFHKRRAFYTVDTKSIVYIENINTAS
jgi:hypothetical protein